MRILIAEDDPVSHLLLLTHLRKWGHEPVATTDGLAAWEALQQPDAPALAILDWMMPGLDGLELCQRIRQTPALSHMYVILLTARDSRADVVRGLEAGADDYLVKPFDAAELRARVQSGIRKIGRAHV